MGDYLTTVKSLTKKLGLQSNTGAQRSVSAQNRTSSSLSPSDDFDDVFYPDSLSPRKCNKMAAKMADHSAKRPLTLSKSVPASTGRMSKRLDSLQSKIDSLYVEMMAIRKSDQEIAKEFLRIYADIQTMKVKKSCLQYEDLLEDAAYESELADEVPSMCDAAPMSMSKLLLSRGVTRMNITSRRFSCS